MTHLVLSGEQHLVNKKFSNVMFYNLKMKIQPDSSNLVAGFDKTKRAYDAL